MRFGGALPEDAPDPRLGIVERLRGMPVPIIGLVPQPNVEDWGSFGSEIGTRDGVVDQMAATITYTLWRNPADRDDPANLADLDDATRRSLDAEPPWPRPRWVIETAERMRHPMLWEAVRTSWHADDAHRPTAAEQLVRHVNHVLDNRYRTRSALDAGPRHPGAEYHVDERHVESGIPVLVDGAAVQGMRIDTDARVLGVAADLGTGGVLTAVLDRDALPYVTVAFATRPLDAHGGQRP